MPLLPSLSAWHFALAGLICAAGPILIHLLNRRRFRVVHWAAMDFLREAIQRNRRILEIRDLVLLALRTAAVLLFGLALARPYLAGNQQKFDGSQPLHAVLLVDNSLSMGYQLLDGTLLDRARVRAREFIDKLPKGSRISVIPMCGSQHGYSPDPYETKEDAIEALSRLELVDRSASLQRAVNEARKACESAPELAKRIVLIGDQQRSNWSDLADDTLEDLPAIQVVSVAPDEWENTWISDLRLQDGLADIQTPTTFIVEVQHRGALPRKDVQVTLKVDGEEVASKTVTLDPAEGARQVSFEYQFQTFQPEPGRAIFVSVEASLAPDSLPADDVRYLAAPVVAALPVVFVDQFSEEEEDPIKHRLGETRPLRKLLAPVTSRNETPSQLVRIRHISLDDLQQDLLTDARLVVIAGIADPGDRVPLLREYLVQGGQLVIAAGANFDPGAWTQAAWLDGAGILPAPLKPETLGALPEESGERLQPFYISYESMSADELFQLAETSPEELRDLYSQPFFFKAVDVDLSADVLQRLRQTETERLDGDLRRMAEVEARLSAALERDVKGELSDGDRAALRDAEQQRRQLRPDWLLWNQAEALPLEALSTEPRQRQSQLDQLVAAEVPRPLARFTNESGPAYLVERQVGRGRVLFVSSGLLSSWSTLPNTDTMFLFDRILRGMIQSTLPKRNLAPEERITLPLPSEDRQVTVQLRRPGPGLTPEMLDIGFIAKDQQGVTISNALTRGLYRVAAIANNDARSSGSDDKPESRSVWEIVLAVNGSSGESDLQPLTRDTFETLAANSQVRWVGFGEEINLAGAQIRGQNTWWYLVLLVFILLLVELSILAWPTWRLASEPVVA